MYLIILKNHESLVWKGLVAYNDLTTICMPLYIPITIILVKQYGFPSSRSTTGVLTIITEFVYQSLDKNCKAQAVVFIYLKGV